MTKKSGSYAKGTRVAALVALMSFNAQAKGSIWTGGAAGNLNSPENWTPDLPGAGDTAIWDGQDGARTSYSAGADVGGTAGWLLHFTGNNEEESIITNTGATRWNFRLYHDLNQAIHMEDGAGAVTFGSTTNTDNPIQFFFGSGTLKQAYGLRNDSGNTLTFGENVNLVRGGSHDASVLIRSGDVALLGEIGVLGGEFGTIGTYGPANLTLGGDNALMDVSSFIIAGGSLSFSEVKNLPVDPLIRFGHGTGGGILRYIGSGDTGLGNQIMSNHSPAAPVASTTIESAGTGTLSFTHATFNAAFDAANKNHTVTLTGSNTGENTISGTVQDNTATCNVGIMKEGDGTWVLSASNTYSGATEIYGGMLVAANDNAFGTGKTSMWGGTRNSVLGLAGDINLAGQRIDYQGRNDDYTAPTGGIRNLSGENTVYVNGMGGGLNYVFHAEKESTLNVDYAVAATVATHSRMYVFTGEGNIHLIGNLTAHAPGTDGIGVYQNSTGTTTMNSTGLYEGTTVVKQGELAVSGRTGAATGGIVVDEGATLRAMANNALRGALENSGTVIFDDTGSTTLYEVLSGTGEYIKRSTGTLNLNAVGVSHDLTGRFTVEEGIVNIGGSEGAGIRLQYAQINKTGGTVTFAGTTDFTFGSLKGTSGLSLENTASDAINLNVGGNDESTTFSGVLSGKGGLTKLGNGTMTLGGTNTYEGVTVVNAGTLLVTGDSSGATNTVTVADGAAMGGSGVIGGDLALDTGAKLVFSTSDTLSVGGTLTVGGFGIAHLQGLDSTVPTGTYTLVEGDVDTMNLSNLGESEKVSLGDDKYAYFQIGSLQVVVRKESIAPGDPPKINDIHIAPENGDVAITVQYEETGASHYVLEFSADLVEGVWTPVATNEVHGSLGFTTNATQGFFRVKAE